MNATQIYNTLREVITDVSPTEMSVYYTRNVDPSGRKSDHIFYIVGSSQDLNCALLPALAGFTNKFEPKEVQVDGAGRKAHISFLFKDESIENAPPEPEKSYDSFTPRKEATSEQVHQCENCRQNVIPEQPPITLRFASDTYEAPSEKDMFLCIGCTPGHYDDVARRVRAFGVSDGAVDAVLFDKSRYYDEDTDRMKTEPPTWFERDEVDNPYVVDTIRAIENVVL